MTYLSAFLHIAAANDQNELVKWAALSNPNISCKQLVRIIREFYSKNATEIVSPRGTTFSFFLHSNPNAEKVNFAIKCVKRYSSGKTSVVS